MAQDILEQINTIATPEDVSHDDIKVAAINIVQEEISAHEDAQVFITDRVAFAMRPLIRTLRKNYWGIFDKPKDPKSGHDKIWVPLTRNVVDSVRKNIDIDSKDFNFRSKHRKGAAVTDLLRGVVREYLDRMFFGEALDEGITQLSIDGTLVWKTIKHTDANGKVDALRSDVDLLNCYIDPTSKSIQAAYRFTERGLLTKDQVSGMDGWMDTENVEARFGLNPNDPKIDIGQVQNTSKYVEVFETWGKIPLWLITGKAADKTKGTEVDGHIVVSNPRKGQGNAIVHVLEKNIDTDKAGNIIKPYEEARYIKVPGRWYGVGPAEMVMALQVWVNTIVNIRINRNRVSQLGIFKIKTGAGITRQMISKLTSNGVIKVKSMDDVEQFQIQEATIGSYKDEEVAVNWAKMVTSTTGSLSGEALPASKTATSAVIEDRNTKSTFTLVREGLGLFLERWTDRHLLPILGERIKKGDDIRIFSDVDNIVRLRERVANQLVMEKVKKITEAGRLPTEAEVQRAIDSTIEKLENDQDLFFKLVDDIIVEGLDTKIYFTNEEFAPAVVADKIITAMQIAPELRGFLLPTLTDILGVALPQGATIPQTPPEGEAAPGQAPAQGRNEQQLTTAAVVPKT